MSRMGKKLRICGMASNCGARTLLAVVVVVLTPPTTGFGWSPPRYGTVEEFQRAMARPLEDVVFSSGTPLRRAVDRLTETQGVAIFLDRRLDPGLGIELAARDQSLAHVLDRLAAQCGGVVSHVGPVAYLGPRNQTANLAQIVQQRRRDAEALPRALARRATAMRPWQWDMLAVPRDLLTDLAEQGGVTIDGMEQVPHDLWPAAALPPLAWTDRMSLVLAGFGLTFEFVTRQQQVRLVPLVPGELTVRSYSVNLTDEQRKLLTAEFPSARLRFSDAEIIVEGSAEEHERLERHLERGVASRRPPRPGLTTLFTMQVNAQPAGAVIKTIEQQLGLQFEVEPEAVERLQRRVTFEAREATLDALLQLALTPAGLYHEYEGERVWIRVTD